MWQSMSLCRIDRRKIGGSRLGLEEAHLRLNPLAGDGKSRCPWPGDDPLYLSYHDEEWGVPERDDRALYEKLMLDGFQAGLSWIKNLRKRAGCRIAFDQFHPEKLVCYDRAIIDALMQKFRIIRNRQKIEGAIF